MTNRDLQASEEGFSLVEVMVAMLVTIVVMASVYRLLVMGQDSAMRESEISQLQQSARVGLSMMKRDLMMAGYKTPSASAIMWRDGGGLSPDEITIIYANPDVPTSRPLSCAEKPGPCDTINNSSTLFVNPGTLDPYPVVPEQAYSERMILFAIETSDCNGDGANGFYPFEVTQPPHMTSTGFRPTLQINHNPGKSITELNVPGGFNHQVHPDCAVIGQFRVIQYRINPLPPTPDPTLERRDLSTGEPWIPVAHDIENLQLMYASGASPDFADNSTVPTANDPLTWINRVRTTLTARSESANLKGASEGIFADGDTYLRKTFSTAVTLRNQAAQAQMASAGLAHN